MKNPAGLASLHAVVHGKVQGVFFRDFVQRHARALELEGYVRNLPEGRSVEVVAEGTKARLEDMVKQLKAGPPAARVDSVDLTWAEYTGGFSRFEVRR